MQTRAACPRCHISLETSHAPCPRCRALTSSSARPVPVAAPFARPPRRATSRALVLSWLVGGVLLFVGTGVGLALLCFSGEQPADTPLAGSEDASAKVAHTSPLAGREDASAKAAPTPTASTVETPAASIAEPAPPLQVSAPAGQAPAPVPPTPPVQGQPQAPAPPAAAPPAQEKKPALGGDMGPPPLVIRPAAAGVGRSGTLTADEQKRVNAAIDRGVAFLRGSQLKSGAWADGIHGVGYAALPGLTLLECGVPPTDAAVKKAARVVRFYAPTLSFHSTYQLSLSILFLDRLGDRKDRKLIQTLALRLITGQNSAGGWHYECPFLTSAQEQQLLKHLRKQQPKHLQEPIAKGGTKNGSPRKPLSEPVTASKKPGALPEGVADARQGQSPGDKTASETKLAEPLPAGAGVKGKPRPPSKVAAKAKQPKVTVPPQVPPQVLPLRPDFMPAYLRNMPFAAGKGPRSMFRPMMAKDDNSNTQFAIMALWAARRHYVPAEQTLALVEARFRASQQPNGAWTYHYPVGEERPSMTCVGLIGLAVGHGSARAAQAPPGAAPGQPATQDAAIGRGLRALGGYLENPGNRRSSTNNLYFLWCVERVGVLYDLKTIGNQDWYRWGVEGLLPAQQADGSWFGRGYFGSAPALDTCMALLFLKRANLTRDLSENLRLYMAITDPAVSSTSGQKR